MTRRLNTTVHVHQGGESFVFGPGDTVPGALAELITNPDVWEDAPAAAPPTDTQQESVGTIPAKSGKGSSLKAWRQYADDNGFETDDDVTREEIIAALTAAGIPTEK